VVVVVVELIQVLQEMEALVVEVLQQIVLEAQHHQQVKVMLEVTTLILREVIIMLLVVEVQAK
jgi:hypothetical protein